MNPTIVLQAPDKETANSEWCHLASLRISIAGTRQLMFTKIIPLLSHVSGISGRAATPKEAYAWFKNLGEEDGLSYTSVHPDNAIFQVTVGPFDAVFTGLCIPRKSRW